MKVGQLRDMTVDELKKFVDEQRSGAVKMRFAIASRQEKDHRQYRRTRRTIARALTILKEKDK
jgi:ribosomal protein L29